MTVAEFIVRALSENGTSDAFGIPGGVIMPLIYAMEKNPNITPHLCYHEQGAAFAACGFVQSGGKLGVAYSTRGPGVTNLITGIADAYSDSLPVLFITAHGKSENLNGRRFAADQELDFSEAINNVTKYSARVDCLDKVEETLKKAIITAVTGRKGPVFLDFASSLFDKEISERKLELNFESIDTDLYAGVNIIKEAIKESSRPVVLIGDGIKQNGLEKNVRCFADTHNVPILSSRYAGDILADHVNYFGYIGSHGTRFGNFILSKADLIIALGNRLSFPIRSASYKSILEKIKIIRVEIDEAECKRKIANSNIIKTDIRNLLHLLTEEDLVYNYNPWLSVCKEIKDELWRHDVNETVSIISEIIKRLDADIITSDVGNNEFWLSRAVVYSKCIAKVLYSKGFGVLGSSLPKAIGACYATGKVVICFTGDQGVQLNMQELQMIADNKLPILVIILDNYKSGMIYDHEMKKYDKPIHTTDYSGYGHPKFEMIAEAYGLSYYEDIESIDKWDRRHGGIAVIKCGGESLEPNLPVGEPCQNLYPVLNYNIYNRLNEL